MRCGTDTRAARETLVKNGSSSYSERLLSLNGVEVSIYNYTKL